MKKIFAAALVLLVVPFSSSAWDKLGHDVSAMIAWENMTSKAKKNISKYLEGHDDIVYYASWMDYMGYVTKSGYSNEWFDHCVPVNKDFEYAEGDFPGDALMAIEKAIERLGDGKYRNLDDSTVLLLIKHLVHFLPDMHCPAHIRYPGNTTIGYYKVDYFGREMRYHTIWDSEIVQRPHPWSFTDLAWLLDRYTETEQAEITSGTVYDWGRESAAASKCIYDVQPGESVANDFIKKYKPLAESQIAKAGYRLAAVLNDVFGK